MNQDFMEAVAESMEMNPALLPYLSELFADFWSLGSFPEIIVKTLKPLKFSADQVKALDLGCGKGVVSVTLAKELGYQVTGVDGLEPFLEEAKAKALEYGVERQCCFIHDDIREYVKSASGFDIVILASVGPVLGNLAQTVTKLRNIIGENGYLLIDDGFLKGEKPVHSAYYQSYRTHAESLEQLTSSGDMLIQEVILPDALIKTQNTQYMSRIRHRVKVLMKQKPQLRGLLEEYFNRQEQECSFLEKHFICAMWLLQKKINKGSGLTIFSEQSLVCLKNKQTRLLKRSTSKII